MTGNILEIETVAIANRVCSADDGETFSLTSRVPSLSSTTKNERCERKRSSRKVWSLVCRGGDVQKNLCQAHGTARGKHANWPCKNKEVCSVVRSTIGRASSKQRKRKVTDTLWKLKKSSKNEMQKHRKPSDRNLPQTDVQYEVQAESEKQMLERMCQQKGAAQVAEACACLGAIQGFLGGVVQASAGNSISRQLKHRNTHRKKTQALSCMAWWQ